MATAGDELLLRDLAVFLAERFVPLLTTIARGSTVPPQLLHGRLVLPTVREPLPLPTSSASYSDNIGGAGGGRAYDVGTSTATTAAAGAAATTAVSWVGQETKSMPAAAAARPTTLTCFAAECALALTSTAALVASSPPSLAAANGVEAPTAGNDAADSGASSAWPLLEANHTPKEQVPAGSLAVTSNHSPVESQEVSSETPQAEEAKGAAGAEADWEKEEASSRQRALNSISGLLPVSTIPLLRLAEAWLGGGEEGATAATPPVTAGGNGELTVSWDNHVGRTAERGGDGLRNSSGGRVGMAFAESGGDPAVGGDAGGAIGLAVRAVRDITAIVIGGAEVSRVLREQHVQRTRVLERDGLEGEKSPIPSDAEDERSSIYGCERLVLALVL